MTEREEFLAAILLRPDDLTARLIFADWLDENGEPGEADEMRKPPKHKPYRPSNGTEGEFFMAAWCYRCTKDRPSRPCGILNRMMCYSEEEPRYPKQLIMLNNVPTCTAFVDRETYVRPPRVRRPGKGQMELFSETNKEK